MTYYICDLHSDNVLCVHRWNDHYYIRSMWDIEDYLTIFQANDIEDAKTALRDVKTKLDGSWVIVNTHGEVMA